MLRKVLVVTAVTVITVFYLNGCKKRSNEAKSGQEVLKTMAEYKAEAKKQVNKENMAEELDNIEKTLEQELRQEQ